ncbi:MAG: C40 family peptidase [Humibacillus sp.]|nr:C40 family peptidase [Humibacillus sp.]MDN5776656.1 C40 family peptidase [Humibacillus sp.]
MAHIAPGRHRAPGRFNPLAELTLIAKDSAQPAVKGAAIVAASGGLVASFAAPSFAADSGSAVVAAAGTSAGASAAVGPAASTAQGTTALTSVGYVTPAAARPAAPIVIEDVLVKTQRAAAAAKVAAKAKADAAARAKAAAAAQEKARARAAAKARAEAATQRQASPARASRSTTRTAVTSTATRSTRSTRSTAPKKSNPAPAPVRAQSASGIAGIAQSLYGVPYVYGGTSTSGFDCSGYTQYVYRRAGISIPRTASAQQNAASRVSSPRPGDLVFFGTPAYHVGIYLGPGRLADAQRPGSVTGNHSIWTSPSGYGRF